MHKAHWTHGSYKIAEHIGYKRHISSIGCIGCIEQAGYVSAYLFLIPFSTIFITQLAPLSLLSPYVSLCDLYDLDVFPYTADTHTPFPLILLMTIHKIPRARSIGSQLWTT